ncbi:CapA family protein [Candidatus Fermentibacteria bacterium]|nr:CapA family protein [Candidatus Fermentibacteria bacterium]
MHSIRHILSMGVATGLLVVGDTAQVWGSPAGRSTTIEDFDDGLVELRSFPGEDADPKKWELDDQNTYQGSPFALRLFGNTWKIEDIAAVQVDSGLVWEIAGYIESSVEIHGFGVMDSANVLFYSLAGTELLDIGTWVTVYQGAFPAGTWNTYRLPVADDWLAYFGYLPRVDAVVFVCDQDAGGTGSVLFDHIVDITADLPIPPQVTVGFTAGGVYRDARGIRNVDVQFSAVVNDPDSETHLFFWDFGDDSTSTEQNPAHTYLVEDDHPYTVILRVVDDTELLGIGSCTVPVDPGASSFPLTMNFVGDIMLARGYEQPGGIIPTQGVEAIFEPTLCLLGPAAQVTVANLESPLTTAPVHHPTKPIYFKASPANIAGLVYAGIDVVTLANNHIYDYLEPGLQETQAVVTGAGILHSGAGLDSYEAYLPVFHAHSGAAIAFLASSDRTGQYNNYQPYLNAGMNKPGFAYMTAYDIGRQIAMVHDHADLVIVETHSGDEYGQVPREQPDAGELADPYGDEDYAASSVRPTARNRAIRQSAIDAGADLVISHHPHVVQGFEVYNGRLIAHSLGNFIFDLRYPETFPTMVLNAEADERGFYEYTVVPAYIDDWIPQPARGGLGRRILDHLARRSREMDTYLYVDTENTRGRIHLDTLIMPVDTGNYYLPARTATFEEGFWITEPLRLARQGNVSSIDSLGPEGGWEYRLGRETLWGGSFEDEGCTLWNLNSPSEWYDSTESYRGARSIRHRRYPDSVGLVVTNLEWRLKRLEYVPTTVHGFVKTHNGAGVCIEIQYYDSRYGSGMMGTESTAPITGDTAWTHVSKELTVPDGALYYDVRVRSDRPEAGEAFSWFDDVALVEWTPWQDFASAGPIVTPNDWYYVQLRRVTSFQSVTLHYTETAYGPLLGPTAAVTPEEIEAAVMAGQTGEAGLVVLNSGNGTLHLTMEPHVPWVQCYPRSGEVLPDGMLAVTLVFNAASLDTGIVQGAVTMRTDDPESPAVTIPLTVVVEPLVVRDLAISVEEAAVHLSWSVLQAAAGYRVYRSATLDGPWELIGSPSTGEFDDLDALGVLPQAFYRVHAVVPDGAGGTARGGPRDLDAKRLDGLRVQGVDH